MHQHFAIHKPFGYLSQFVNRGPKQQQKKLLGELYDFPKGSMAIGRLDEDSEGLLLITTDGKMSELVRSRKFEKEYYAQVDGIIHDTALAELRAGLCISTPHGKYQTQACSVQSIKDPMFPLRIQKIRDPKHGPNSWISICLREGKFRQVRKMTAAVGFPTLRLVRVRIGSIHLGEMRSGEIRQLENFSLYETEKIL